MNWRRFSSSSRRSLQSVPNMKWSHDSVLCLSVSGERRNARTVRNLVDNDGTLPHQINCARMVWITGSGTERASDSSCANNATLIMLCTFLTHMHMHAHPDFVMRLHRNSQFSHISYFYTATIHACIDNLICTKADCCNREMVCTLLLTVHLSVFFFFL